MLRQGREGDDIHGWRMTALGKLLRTTAFKLTLVYLTIFALFAAFLLGYFAWNTRRLITEQLTQTVDAEITGLSEQYRQGGIRRLVLVVDSRSRRPGSSLYLVTTPTGEGLAGNVGSLATGILETPGWAETAYRRLDDPDGAGHHALVRVFQLPGGFRLLVGRDLEERERLYDVVLAAGRWSVAIVVVLGLAGGFFVTRRVLKRIDGMTEATRAIMQGDLHERLPIAGTGDELDRLAVNLNAMLERIEALMHGLKEVSDNIAHDLKTPLTRLHNRCEEALRAAKTEAQYREALASTIEESEALIRTFNALLMIARAESGQARDDMTEFDAAEQAMTRYKGVSGGKLNVAVISAGDYFFPRLLAEFTRRYSGVVLNLAVWFGIHVLFPGTEQNRAVDWFAVVISVVAFFGMVRWKWDVVPVVLGAGVLGIIYRALL